MSEALKVSNARQQVEEAYNKMMEAYDRYYHFGRNDNQFWLDYKAQLNNYRDLCTVIVKRLLSTNPKALEELNILYLA